MTLLKNENDLLPLSKSVRQIAVIGPNADVARYGDVDVSFQVNNTGEREGLLPCLVVMDRFLKLSVERMSCRRVETRLGITSASSRRSRVQEEIRLRSVWDSRTSTRSRRRKNLKKEISGRSFDQVKETTRELWNKRF